LTVALLAAEKAVFSGGKTGTLIGSADDEVIEGRVAKNSAVPASLDSHGYNAS
jgi:hypothetical protein